MTESVKLMESIFLWLGAPAQFNYNSGGGGMPYYVQHMSDILDEIGIPDVKAYRVRVDQYVQEILGTRDLDADEVWKLLQPKLQDPGWRTNFIRQLREKWDARDWHKEGLG